MRALGIDLGQARASVIEAPVPTPGPGEILVEIRVSAVNEMDVQVRSGGWAGQVKRFRRAGPVLTGFEFAGVARSDGARIRSGRRVIGYSHVLNGPRTHAEFACVHERDVQVIPDDLSDEGAAALVVMGLTAIEVLERIRRLKAGEQCLVIGAAGGVGVYATQLAASQGAKVTAIASRANTDWVRAQGAGEVRAYEDGPRYRAGDRFDLVIDAPAKSSFAEAATYLAPGGTYVTTNPTADMGGFVRAMLSGKRAGWLMMLRTDPAKLSRLVELWRMGAMRPAIDSVYALEDADAAFDRFAARGKQGRVLLKI
ncbi:NAD(P)-dependent alcohol dehydrogenase [Phenylobacterium sp. LjRoot164]|uniref:NAD(P)-dependent alcohol dehydrogenase n=1 Tax=unclassified Phenylobacterium TaxID=2640670 RepID=UPI003ECD10C5